VLEAQCNRRFPSVPQQEIRLIEPNATVQVAGNSASVETNDPLSMREGLTADVYITKGVLKPPSLLSAHHLVF